MGKKSKDEKNESMSCHATRKFAVLEAPGVTQPSWEPAAAAATADSNDASAGDAQKTTKDGLQGRRANASTGPKIATEGVSLGGDSFVQRTANPAWLQSRSSVYAQIAQRRAEELASKQPAPITVTLPDGKVLTQDKEGQAFCAWKTTPYDVAATISQGLADAATVARVTYESFAPDYSPAEDGMEGEDTLMDAMADGGIENANDKAGDQKVLLWDMARPLVGQVSKLEFLKFEEDSDAKTVFWHSSAHMMGEALEHLFGCKLTIGPPLAGGFYYDSYMGNDALREEDCT